MDNTIHHPIFYFDDGNIVFQADQTLFRLHQGILTVHSAAWRDILKIPSGIESDGTEAHPILLEGITESEFAHFVTWVYHVGSNETELDEAALIAILKVSRLWMIENSITWAVNHLARLDLSPARKLQLARMYIIPAWIAPAIRQLMALPLASIAASDADNMGLVVYTIVARAHEATEKERKALAAVPPGLALQPSPGCNATRHVYCVSIWGRFWWLRVARSLLHPTRPLQFTSLLGYVAELPHPDGLNLQCKEAALAEMVESGALQVGEQIIEGAIAAVQSYYDSITMQA
ncbi:hypothetical protein BU15DRAFT_84126 [Melanogaster broomeanus]|nr:hypothetical protein BU15DRAFT_84126 [Melanogaster broomeanus]